MAEISRSSATRHSCRGSNEFGNETLAVARSCAVVGTQDSETKPARVSRLRTSRRSRRIRAHAGRSAVTRCSPRRARRSALARDDLLRNDSVDTGSRRHSDSLDSAGMPREATTPSARSTKLRQIASSRELVARKARPRFRRFCFSRNADLEVAAPRSQKTPPASRIPRLELQERHRTRISLSGLPP
jgi:hypothetical protein